MKVEKNWYLTTIALIYLILCSISCVRYLIIDFVIDDAYVPFVVQFLCFGMAISSWLYLFKTSLGHKGLILFTSIAIITIGTESQEIAAYHTTLLFILLLPIIRQKMVKKQLT